MAYEKQDYSFEEVPTAAKVQKTMDNVRDHVHGEDGVVPFPPSLVAGAIVPYLGATSPDTGAWLLCNGAAVSRSTYADLFDVIGETFGGGDGESTFNVPDLRGRIPLGLDNLGGASADKVTITAADSLGGIGGIGEHQLTIAEMPSHNHGSVHDHSATNNMALGVNRLIDNESQSGNSSSTGGSQPHQNASPFLTCSYLIKV